MFVSIPGADSRALRILVYSPEIHHIPRVTAFRAPAEKGLREPPLGGLSKSQTSRAGEDTNLFFESETSADPLVPVSDRGLALDGEGDDMAGGLCAPVRFLALAGRPLGFLFRGVVPEPRKGRGVFLDEFFCQLFPVVTR